MGGVGRENEMSNLTSNVDYILDNREEFRRRYADITAKFEDMGIDSTTAEAMAITIAATSKAITDELAK